MEEAQQRLGDGTALAAKVVSYHQSADCIYSQRNTLEGPSNPFRAVSGAREVLPGTQRGRATHPRAWKAGMDLAQCMERKSRREADSQM